MDPYVESPMIAVSDVKPFLNIRDADQSFDAYLETFIDVATGQIEHELNTSLTRSRRTKYFDTAHMKGPHLDLHGKSESGLAQGQTAQTFPLAVMGVEEDPDVEVFYDPSHRFDAPTRLYRNQIMVGYREGNVTTFVRTSAYREAMKITFTSGFEPGEDGTLTDNLPRNLRMAAIFQTAFLFRRAKTDNIGMQGDRAIMSDKSNVAAGRWNAQQGLCDEAVSVLRRFKRPALGRG